MLVGSLEAGDNRAAVRNELPLPYRAHCIRVRRDNRHTPLDMFARDHQLLICKSSIKAYYNILS
jgi:hypothetical protein